MRGEQVNSSDPLRQSSSEKDDSPLPATVDFRGSQLVGGPVDSTLKESASADTFDNLTPGRVFGDYEILSQLGEGGMGVVYQARQRGLKRVVALKTIRAGEFAHADQILRFQAEAQSVARLNHPGIVPVYEVGVCHGLHFFSMQFLAGGSLSDRLQEGPLPPKDGAEIVRQVAEAVQAAHDQQLIHRDLKPGNILLDEQGDPFVADFGLAKQLDSDQNLTHTGEVMGTPSYMAPEQALGLPGQIGPAADVYALGAILYHLLTGRPPFQGASKMDTLRQVVEQTPVSPRQLNAAIPRDLETISLKCLEKSAARRYGTAEEMARDLGRYLAGEPILARTVGRLDRGVRWCRRKPVAAALAVVATMLLAVLTIGGPLVAIREFNHKSALQNINTQLQGRSSELQSANTLLSNRTTQLARTTDELQDEVARANAAVDDARLKLYYSQIARANAELAAKNPAAAQVVLESVPFDLRGWEHRYLTRRASGTPLTLRGHSFPVKSVRFGPDGKQIVSGSWDGTVKLWDSLTGENTIVMNGHSHGVDVVCFSPDGTRLASGSNDQTVKLWDTGTGEEIATLRGHSKQVGTVCFSPDGARLASGSGDYMNPLPSSGEIKLWDSRTGEELATFGENCGGILSLSFSPDGTRLASGSRGDDPLRLWDARTGQELASLPGERDRVHSVCFSPDGARLAGSSLEGHVHLYDAQTRQEIISLRGHTSGVNSVCFSPDGARLASGSDDLSVKLWDVGTGQEIITMLGHSAYIDSVDFSPDGMRLVSGSSDFTVKVWDLSGRENSSALGVPTDVGNPGPGGTTRASSYVSRDIVLRDARTGAEIATLSGHSDLVESVSYSPDRTRLASGSLDGTAKLWNARTGEEIDTLRGHASGLRSVAFSPDGERLASGSDDYSIKLWDAWTGEELSTLRGHTNFVRSVAFSPDRTRLASGSDDRTVKLWNALTGQEISTLRGHSGVVLSVCFSPDGARLISGSWDKTLKVWDAQTGEMITTLYEHTTWSMPVHFSSDGTIIIPAAMDGVVWGWDARIAEDVFALHGPTTPINDLRFTDDGAHLMALESRGMKWVWAISSGELLEFSPGHTETGPIESRLAMDPQRTAHCGRYRAAIGSDSVKLIRLAERNYDPWAEDEARRQRLTPRWHGEQAQTAESRSNWFAAAFHLRRLIALSPDDQLLADRHDVVPAQSDPDKLNDAQLKALAELHVRLGLALHHLHRHREAISAFNQALLLHPEHPAAISWRADSWARLGEWRQAVPDFEVQCQWPTSSCGHWYWLGLAQLAAGNVDGCLEATREAWRRFGDDEANWGYLLHLVIVHPNEVRDSESVFKNAEALFKEQGDASAWVLVAARYRNGDYAQALDLIAAMPDIHRNTYLPSYFAALAHHHQGHHEESHEAYRRGLQAERALADPRTEGDWTNPVTARILRREAARLLGIETRDEEATADADRPADKNPPAGKNNE